MQIGTHRFSTAIVGALVSCLVLAATALGTGPEASSSSSDPGIPADVAGDVVPAALADDGCGSGNGCVWENADFAGTKVVFNENDAGKVIILGGFNRSAKNRFGDRRMRFFAENGDLLSCINAGGSDRNLYGRTYRLAIGAADNPG